MSISSCGIGHEQGAVRPLNTIAETEGILRCSRATVYRLVVKRDLKLVKLGSKSLITGQSIERLITRMLGQDA